MKNKLNIFAMLFSVYSVFSFLMKCARCLREQMTGTLSFVDLHLEGHYGAFFTLF